ncbi:hypothetical protein [Pontibacter rugosus]|uniref:Transmembrane protein n=1 Tax=Pontibacter rugosus TaxID=1745966 RepID=A0ABW3SP60_9BACT
MRIQTLLLLLLLLCSCVTQRKAEDYFDKNTDKLAAYVDQNDAYTDQFGEAYASKHFPAKAVAPAMATTPDIHLDRLQPWPLLIRTPQGSQAHSLVRCPACAGTITTQIVYVQDTAKLQALGAKLTNERITKQKLQKQLQHTIVERDYWQEMNRKKFWTLVAMAAFAMLYILFRVLAARVPAT